MCNAPAVSQKRLGRRLNGSQGLKPWEKSGITVSVFQCQNCRLIYTNPQLVPINIQDHYGIPPEEYWSQEYMDLSADYFSSELEISKKLLNFREGMKALDIGAGLGKCMTALSRAGYVAHGIEPSLPFYQRAISTTGIMPERLQLTSLEDADFPRDEFDFITFGAVLEHLFDPSASLHKVLKWLKPGGIIHIEVPSSNWFVASLLNAYYKVTMSDYVCNLSPLHTPYHLYEFGLESFCANGARQGYTVAAHQYYVCKTYLPKWIDPFVKAWMRRTNSGMQLCVWLQKDLK